MAGKVVHCKVEDYDVYIGRSRGTRGFWGNPFSHKEGAQAKFKVATREAAISSYKSWLWQEIKAERITLEQLAALDGKTLGCWCKPKSCHGDVLTVAAEWAKRELFKK